MPCREQLQTALQKILHLYFNKAVGFSQDKGYMYYIHPFERRNFYGNEEKYCACTENI